MSLFYENVGLLETLPLFGEEAHHVNINIDNHVRESIPDRTNDE